MSILSTVNTNNDSDAEYERLAKEYEQQRGVKLPARHKGSQDKAALLKKQQRGFPRQPLNKEKSPEQERAPVKASNPSDLKKSSIQALEFQISAINEELMKPSDNYGKIKNLVETLEKMHSLIEAL